MYGRQSLSQLLSNWLALAPIIQSLIFLATFELRYVNSQPRNSESSVNSMIAMARTFHEYHRKILGTFREVLAILRAACLSKHKPTRKGLTWLQTNELLITKSATNTRITHRQWPVNRDGQPWSQWTEKSAKSAIHFLTAVVSSSQSQWSSGSMLTATETC